MKQGVILYMTGWNTLKLFLSRHVLYQSVYTNVLEYISIIHSRISNYNKLGFDMQLMSPDAQNVPESEKIRIIVSVYSLSNNSKYLQSV